MTYLFFVKTDESVKFSRYLSQLKRQTGWPIKEIAKRAGLSRQQVAKHLNGDAMAEWETRVAYAEAFGVDIMLMEEGWPAGNNPPMVAALKRAKAAELSTPSGIDASSERSGDDDKSPRFALAVAAGPWTEVGELGVLWNEKQKNDGLFRIDISGDSMQPEYPDGSTVKFWCVRWGLDEMEVGKDYYVQRETDATFKRLIKIEEEQLTFVAVNRKKYPKPIIVRRDDITRLALAKSVTIQKG